jgi:hypothetical protein
LVCWTKLATIRPRVLVQRMAPPAPPPVRAVAIRSASPIPAEFASRQADSICSRIQVNCSARSVSPDRITASSFRPAAVWITVTDMIAVAGIRWRIEECNEQGKDLIGLDQHQVRTWTAFHHHVTVCMFAHAFAATRKARLHHNGPSAAEGAHRGNDSTPTRTRRRQPAVVSGDD